MEGLALKWFKHFTDAHDNNDLTKLRMKHGAEGYAVYWYCLELVAGDLGTSDVINFELKHDAEVIGFNLKIDQLRVEEIMRYCITLGLFESSDNRITCLKLAKYLDKKTTRNSHIHKIIDSAAMSPTVPDNLGHFPTVPDRPDLPPLDTNTDTDKKTNTPKPASENGQAVPACPVKEILELWNELVPELPSVRVKSFMGSKTRRRQLELRWKEDEGRQNLDFWRTAFGPVIHSNQHWMGANGWRPDLDWFLKPSNIEKLYSQADLITKGIVDV